MPEHIAKYELLETRGTGEVGTVYRALDRMLGVTRAVKVLHPALAACAVFVQPEFRKLPAPGFWCQH